jgi:hypothetical protein
MRASIGGIISARDYLIPERKEAPTKHQNKHQNNSDGEDAIDAVGDQLVAHG